MNIATAPVEITRRARASWIKGAEQTDHILVWIFAGTVEGLVEGVKRAGAGLWDVVTFPVAVPEDYGTFVEPEFVFEDWPSRGDRAK